jgi:3-dehydroquinate synthase
LHGEAIAVGMIGKLHFIVKNWSASRNTSLIKTTIKSIFDDVSFFWKWHWTYTELLIHDKKWIRYNQFALIEGIGKIKINQSVENEFRAFNDYKS